MDASDLLFTQWVHQVKQIWSEMHEYRQESFALAILGIVLAGQAVIQRVAEILHERLSSPCKVTSYERRLQRLIDNEKLAVTATWERFLQHTLSYWDKRRALLVLDCTPYNETFTIVFVGILVQKRLLPLAWEIMPQSQKWEQSQWQIVDQIDAQVASFLHAPHVTLLADRGLTGLPLIRLCEQREWHYILRMQNETYCRRAFRHSYRDWQRGCDFLLKAGTSWHGKVLVWKEHGFACHLSAGFRSRP